VGSAFAAGALDTLEKWVRALAWSGLIEGVRIAKFIKTTPCNQVYQTFEAKQVKP
jgi:hypothetical protein